MGPAISSIRFRPARTHLASLYILLAVRHLQVVGMLDEGEGEEEPEQAAVCYDTEFLR
jgi:hypothetical protein